VAGGKRCAVLGAPIAHSLSPVLHRAAYASLGLRDWAYDAVACDEAALPGLLDGLDASWAGLSLTMPLKRAVLPLLDDVSELAVTVGGANTVTFRDGRRRGDNTDVAGIVAALAEAGGPPPRSAVVLGAGATAASTLAALREMGVADVTVLARDLRRTTDLREAADRLGAAPGIAPLDDIKDHLGADLLVSTLPSGAADALAPLVAGAPPRVVFDVVYAPWPTTLGAAAADAGAAVVGGLPMLVHQAARQVELMTGRRVPETVVADMRAAGESELARRAS
jgi:shikimate dehydrogenase